MTPVQQILAAYPATTDPKHLLELFLRVITVNLETNCLVAGLPRLEID